MGALLLSCKPLHHPPHFSTLKLLGSKLKQKPKKTNTQMKKKNLECKFGISDFLKIKRMRLNF